MGLESKDLGILLICAVTAFVSLQYQGEVEVTPIFGWPNRDHEREIHVAEWQRLPKPIITDMDGDGINEVVVASSEPKIQIFKMVDGSSATDTKLAQPTLFASASLLSSVRVRTGRHPVAIATGFRSPYKQGYNRRQVVVVLTREWTVLCFDYKLKLLWRNNVQQSVKAEFPTNLFIREVAILVDSTAIQKGDAGSVFVGGSMSHDRETSTYRLKSLKARKKEQLTAEQANDYHHFSYYAFDGKSGGLRWKHEASTFHDVKPAHEVLETPSNFKNDESRLLHQGQVDWRIFRKTLLSHLPHSWQRREDTQMVLAHFDRRKRSDSATNGGLAGQLKQAIPTAHIPSLADWTMPHSPQEHVAEPNTIVVHLAHGIEVVHLYTGRTICQLTVSGGVWEDVNNDGVIDNALAYGSQDHAGTLSDLDVRTQPKCFGHLSTGVPRSAELFNVTVCNPMHYDLYTNFDSQKHVEVVHPVTVERPTADGKDVVFFASNGEVTSVNPKGVTNWKTETIASWEPTHMKESIEELLLLHLHEGLPARAPDNRYLLAVAPGSFALLEPEHGSIVQEVSIPKQYGEFISVPVAIGDLNGDGVSDLLFGTPDSLIAFAVERRPSSRLFSLLVGVLVMLILFTLAMNQVQTTDRKTDGKSVSNKLARD